jgi:hypothetical protein
VIDPQQIFGRGEDWHRTNLGDFGAAGRGAPLLARVNNQTLPETAAANDVGLAAEALCAWSSAGKFSIRQ